MAFLCSPCLYSDLKNVIMGHVHAVTWGVSSIIRGRACGCPAMQWGWQHSEMPFLGFNHGTHCWPIFRALVPREHIHCGSSSEAANAEGTYSAAGQLTRLSFEWALPLRDVLRYWIATSLCPPQKGHLLLEHWIQQPLCLRHTVLSVSICLFIWGAGWVNSISRVPYPVAPMVGAAVEPIQDQGTQAGLCLWWSHCHSPQDPHYQEAWP